MTYSSCLKTFAMLCWLMSVQGQKLYGQAGSRSDAVLAALDTSAMRRHLITLSHDSMEGRAPDTPGGRKAAEYIASRFRDWGLSPAGDSGGYFHHFDFSIVRNIGSSIQVAGDSLLYGIEQAGTTLSPAERASARGQAVFAGYGIEGGGREDFRGKDLRGKIAIVLAGLPPGSRPEQFPTDADTRTVKTTLAARHGAVGTIVIHRNDIAGFDWKEISQYWSQEQAASRLLGRMAELRAPPLSFWIRSEAAERLLRGSGYSIDQLVEMAKVPTMGPVELPLVLDLAVTNQVRQVNARNVVGMVPGEGPLAEEVVVIGGHYDHLGFGPAVRGDSIYNGAEDNAGGTAQLLMIAEAFARSPSRPGRSVLFIGFDGEEIGLLGAEAFVRRPTVPLRRQVAMINLDAANLYGATRDLSALGLKESTLDSTFRRAARQEGLTVPPSQPDTIEAFFLRSDQLPFARAGVPAIFLFLGWDFVGRTPAWSLEQWNRYFNERYHQPDDEYQDWFSMAGALQQARVVARMTVDLASRPDRPAWLSGSRFRRP